MTTEKTLTIDAYLASGEFGPALLTQTIGGGAALAKGTIMGRITATGKLVAYAAANSDGSENPIGVLMEAADASAGDVKAVVGFAGKYVKANMTGLDAAAITALEARAVYFE